MLVRFFFSSRRRHTRLQGDWSSDVCSSDLNWMGMQEPVARLATPPAGTVLQMAGVQGGDRVLRIALGDQEWEEVRSINDLRWTLTRAALDDESVDRKSTRLNSSHLVISYAVFCLKKKKAPVAQSHPLRL